MTFNIAKLNEDLKSAIRETAEEFSFAVSETDGILLDVYKAKELSVNISDTKISIGYPSLNLLFRGLNLALRNNNAIEQSHNGELAAMLDCSRNAVYTVNAAKKMVRHLAFMGYNTLQLYLEDTFGLENEPYFGYLRSKYKKEEFKEIDAYAKKFGIEVVPSIQTLAHFNTIARWSVYFLNIFDCDDILLADDEKTYVFIEKIFASLSESLTSRKINIGMDEAFLVGSGKHLEIYGYQSRFEIICRHLKRVLQIAKKYGYEPMMWGDMFFKLTNGEISKEQAEKIPSDVKLIYWDYASDKKEYHDEMLNKYTSLKNEVAFAGGAWIWNGFTPNVGHSVEAQKAALSAIKQNGKVKDIQVTMWGDNGAEGSPFSALTCLYITAEILHSGKENKEYFNIITGIDFDGFLNLVLANAPDGDIKTLNNPSKYLLYNDPFKGMMDSTVTESDSEYYIGAAKILAELCGKNKFSYLYKTQKALCEVLSLKTGLGIETRKAYHSNDIAALKKLLKNAYYPLIPAIENFHKCFKEQWLEEKKSGGFDVQDARIGGLIQRIKSCADTLEKFINKEITKIDDLEEEQIDYETSGKTFSKKHVCLNKYGYIVSTNSFDNKT